MADVLNIAGRIHSISEEGVSTTADEILDESVNKKQSVINQEVGSELANHESRLNALTSQNYVTVTATSGTTAVTDVLPAEGEMDTVYRVGSWNGTQYNATTYSEYAWTGVSYMLLDVKEYGIDDEPVAGSENLVKSRGVYPLVSKLNGLRIEPVYYFNQLFDKDFVGNPSGENWEYGGDGYLIGTNGKIYANSPWFTSNLIHWNGKNKAYCASVRSIVQYDNQMNIVSVYFPSSIVSGYYLSRADNAAYFKISVLAASKSAFYVNYDDIKGNGTYREFRYNVLECFEQLESYVLSESFRPADLTWSEGLPNTPVSVVYPSGVYGQISFVRVVATGLINSITATMNVQGNVLTSTFAITRNSAGNITKILTTKIIN